MRFVVEVAFYEHRVIFVIDGLIKIQMVRGLKNRTLFDFRTFVVRYSGHELKL